MYCNQLTQVNFFPTKRKEKRQTKLVQCVIVHFRIWGFSRKISPHIYSFLLIYFFIAWKVALKMKNCSKFWMIYKLNEVSSIKELQTRVFAFIMVQSINISDLIIYTKVHGTHMSGICWNTGVTTLCTVLCEFFFKNFGGHKSFLWGH